MSGRKTIAALLLMELMMVVAAVVTSTMPMMLWNLIRGLFTIPAMMVMLNMYGEKLKKEELFLIVHEFN